MKFNKMIEKYGLEASDEIITLYRGMETEFDSEYDLKITDAPYGYSTWTDNPKLGRAYAGEEGYVYKISLPKSAMGDTYIDDEGERVLFYNNEKPAGLHGISGDEYLVYHDHELFNDDLIELFMGPTK